MTPADSRPSPPPIHVATHACQWEVTEHEWGRRFRAHVFGAALEVDAIDRDEARTTAMVNVRQVGGRLSGELHPLDAACAHEAVAALCRWLGSEGR